MNPEPSSSPPMKAANAVIAGPRFLAKLVDLTIVLGFSYLVFHSASAKIGYIGLIVSWLLYNWLMVARYGATLGKMIVGAVVVSNNDSPCEWWRSLARVLFEYFYLIPLVWIISVIIFLFDKGNRSPLDHTVGTRVVERRNITQFSKQERLNITKSVGIRLVLCALSSLISGYILVTEGIGLNWDQLAIGLALGAAWSVVILFLTPFLARILWKFLLNRLTELSQAVRGNK
ncbi:MAG: hypothetical protein RLZ22_1267 [Verrucomicrobiota bacterium]|jgi:uncharacterized RDD family membrane protein YckC